MTNLLILYASLGAGHASAAKALYEAFSQSANVNVQIEDALAHANPLLRETLTAIYEGLSEKVPQGYRLLYEGIDIDDLERSVNEINLLLAKIERPFLKDLEHLVYDTNPDAVICVQQIPSRLLQLMDRKGKLNQPHYVVVTDMIAHSTWINYGVDGYFLPSQLSADILIQRGVDPALLHVTGIPIKLEIAKPKSPAEMRQQHDLPLDVPVITIFGGGLQAKRVRPMVSKLVESPQPGMLVVVAGRNETLLDKLEDITDGVQMKVRKLGLIDYVDDLVAASDLVISKAGGLITSEVLARATPMVIIDPFPGQEEWNADMVAAYGAGIQLRLAEMVPPTVLHLLERPDQLAFMQQQARTLGKPKAAINIADKILADLRSVPDKPRIDISPTLSSGA